MRSEGHIPDPFVSLNNHLPPLEPGRTIDYAYYGVVGGAKESGDLNLCYTPEANPSFYGDYTEYCHVDYSHQANGFTNAFIKRKKGQVRKKLWEYFRELLYKDYTLEIDTSRIETAIPGKEKSEK